MVPLEVWKRTSRADRDRDLELREIQRDLGNVSPLFQKLGLYVLHVVRNVWARVAVCQGLTIFHAVCTHHFDLLTFIEHTLNRLAY